MAVKVYVGNLSYQLTEQALSDFFAPCGDVVSATIVKDRDTNRSKGFGFVELADEAAIDAALELNGQELDGRQIRVNRAHERDSRPPRTGGGGGRGGNGGGAGGGRNRW